MGTVAAKSIKIKDVVGEPKGYINRAIRKDEIKVDRDGTPELGQRILVGYILGRVIQRATHGRTITDPNGNVIGRNEWPKLLGDFECIPVDAALDTHRAPAWFAPPHICDQLAMLLTDLRKEGELDPIIEVAYKCEIETSDTGSAGFEWRYSPIREEKPANDPLEQLRILAGKDAGVKLAPPEKPKGGKAKAPVAEEAGAE